MLGWNALCSAQHRGPSRGRGFREVGESLSSGCDSRSQRDSTQGQLQRRDPHAQRAQGARPRARVTDGSLATDGANEATILPARGGAGAAKPRRNSAGIGGQGHAGVECGARDRKARDRKARDRKARDRKVSGARAGCLLGSLHTRCPRPTRKSAQTRQRCTQNHCTQHRHQTFHLHYQPEQPEHGKPPRKQATRIATKAVSSQGLFS